MNPSAAAAVVLVVTFVATRVALVVTSYDVNVNWEEPVFLFSGLELARDGLGHVFDHQDDLNHGGSVALLLLVVPWLRVIGTSLLTLKGLEIVWSTATLIAFLALGWRYFSPRVALLWGLCFVAASPTLARLHVTLVGSHPEALLPCAFALAAYLAWVRRRERATIQPAGLAFLLGLWSGIAVWISYVAVMFIGPVLVLRAAHGRDRRLVLVVAGLLTGIAPWLVQNLWLRPHGAGLWRGHVAAEGSRHLMDAAGHTLSELAASFGWASPAGAWLLTACGAALVILTLTVIRRPPSDAPDERLVLLPFVAAAYLGFAMLVAATLPDPGAEGYYHYRFYVGVQVALFWVLALAVDRLTRRANQTVIAGIAVAVAVGALWGQGGLLGQGNHYRPNLAQDRARGCTVFGVAEGVRAPDWPSAITRLGAIRDDLCRGRAFAGLGWGIGDAFLESRDAEAARTTLALVVDERLRWEACGGFNFIVSHAPSSKQVSPEEQAAAWRTMRTVCERPPHS